MTIIKNILIPLIIEVLFGQLLIAQSINKIVGPMGLYHIGTGYSFTDSSGTDSIPLNDEFRFGEFCIPNQPADVGGISFQVELDSCAQWGANRIFGIIQPTTEGGVINQPDDTALYLPVSPPGMIQGAKRFSRLSQVNGAIAGIVLDDWNGDTAVTHQVRDALLGKYVDASGNVCSECIATTPYNKLYCVLYNNNSQPDPGALAVIDGISFWNDADQNCCYTTFDSDITQLRINFPNKQILAGIFLKNSALGWTDPTGVQYLIEHALDRYDDGDINGITLATGYDLTTNYITPGIWNALNLPFWLDSLYYPYLGEGQGKLLDCKTGNTLGDAFISVYCIGRISGDTLLRSRQKSDANGQFSFGLWAGNRNTDSTYYWLIAEKPGYIPDTTAFWIKRNDTSGIPNLVLCTQPDTIKYENNNLLIFPNPTTGKLVVQDNKAQETNGTIKICNMLGKVVYSGTQNFIYTPLDVSSLSDGFYLVYINTTETEFSKAKLLMILH